MLKNTTNHLYFKQKLHHMLCKKYIAVTYLTHIQLQIFGAGGKCRWTKCPDRLRALAKGAAVRRVA